jgi:hypothetical protein
MPKLSDDPDLRLCLSDCPLRTGRLCGLLRRQAETGCRPGVRSVSRRLSGSVSSEFKAKNGWNLFLKQGAHFTDCYYDYANLVTAAGHATIGTGAYTDGHGIPLNEWYEPGPDGEPRQVSSVADDRYTFVGAPAGTRDLTGASAHREMATTLGDELVLATGGRARVLASQ